MTGWGDAFLARYRWYRRWRGGHFERWWIDSPIHADVWMQTTGCSRRTGYRPPLGRGRPTCEDYATVGYAVPS